MTVTLHDGTVGKLFGSVRYIGQRFHPEIVVAADRLDVTLWCGVPCWDVGGARAALAEAVALVGLCFWPHSYLNDNGRELGVSPWVHPVLTIESPPSNLTPDEIREVNAAFDRYLSVPPTPGSTLRSEAPL